MILPCLLYRVPDDVFIPMMERFQPLCNDKHVYLQIVMRSDDAEDVADTLHTSTGVLLLITCVEGASATESQRALRLGHMAMRKNRDNYVIYTAPDSRTMLQITPHCLRPAGIVTNAILAERPERLIQTILSDYASICQEVDDSPFMQFKVQGAIRRVQMGSIIAITSANKKVNVILEDETLTLYESLESLLEKLDERFIRCHRTCVINRQKISRIDFADLNIIMLNGLEVPLARALKKAFRTLDAISDGVPAEEGG